MSSPLTGEERKQFAALPFDEAAFKRQIGVEGFSGEAGFTTLERRWARPTCDVNGLTSGYQGEGAKTVLPAPSVGEVQLSAWFPKQDPKKISAALEPFLRTSCSRRGSIWN